MTPVPLPVGHEPSLVFPPVLARVARERLAPLSACLAGVADEELVRLLTTVFFAGLETYEGEHHSIGVTFVGRSESDFVMTDAAAAAGVPLYRWKILRFASPRPFVPRELAKLSVASAERRIYSAVGVLDDGSLAVIGLAREGVNSGPDPFVKIVTSRPGCLEIRSGRELVIEYERGAILAVTDDPVFAADSSIHRALKAIACDSGVEEHVVPHYLDAVAFLVREMIAHGRGGILIIGTEEEPVVTGTAPYAMVLDSSLASLLRLAWRIGSGPQALTSTTGARRSGDPRMREASAPPAGAAFGQLLRSAFLTEAERIGEEFGRLTAIDGAVLLNCNLGLAAFGIILPVGGAVPLIERSDSGDYPPRLTDFDSRGTRHRAAATYAAEHPGSVVFVASEDGQVSCLLRESPASPVRLWHLGTDMK
ncbi:MAG TPA: hypothetical protein VM819_14765 [Vicinamibacterales bacterium]|nr:hypothetical protein [Vicinamibacterales bacterium]